MKVLEIGPNIKPQAQLIFQNAEIETMDADKKFNPTYLCDARYPPEELKEKFDAVFSSHVLEHVPFYETQAVLNRWVEMVKPGGELHIVVPSLEWAAEQILAEHPDQALFGHLFGGLTSNWDIHMSGFTMRYLRYVVGETGLKVQRARSGPYTILFQGKEHTAEQHYVMGIKELKEKRKRHK